MVFYGEINRKKIVKEMTINGFEIYDFIRLVFLTLLLIFWFKENKTTLLIDSQLVNYFNEQERI